jgi:hypothetical protein
MSKRSEVIGHFGVDSGQCIIADPCYLQYFKNDDFGTGEEDEAGTFSYSGACNLTISEKQGGQLWEPYKGQGAGTGSFEAGVAVSTGYGDGVYPVTAHYNEDGRVSKITIDFE